MKQTAARFLTRCFAPDETIALLLRGKHDPAPMQRVITLETMLAPRYLAWLAYENATGANVYIAANPLRAGSRHRTKECIASVRHLYLDIDIDGDARLAALRASDAVPTPSAILSTSPGKYQVLWRVDGFDFTRQERTLKLLATAFGGDPACTDCNRVLRIPGFFNRKYDPAHRVTVEYPCDSISNTSDFRLESVGPIAPSSGNDLPPRKRPAKHSNSEMDWAWVCHELVCGKDPTKLTLELARRRSDKPDPLYYAQRTVDVASARLWLTEGVRIDDVIAMLECRRRFEIPAALCCARAREVASTAERLVARGKIA